VEKTLKKFGMFDCNQIITPLIMKKNKERGWRKEK